MTLAYPLKEEYLFGIDLRGRNLRFEAGVPSYRYKDGYHHNPAYICWWALLNLNQYVKTKNKKNLDAFLIQADWLEKNAKRWGKGMVWTYDFDWNEGKAILRKPWISAMSQGLAMSVLTRAYKITHEKRYLETARSALPPFSIEVRKHGLMTKDGSLVFYEEYPAYPLARVLDGYIFALLGLHDLHKIGKDKMAGQLFTKGAQSLLLSLHRWDWKGKWSWYGTRGLLSTPHYNRLNSRLLSVLHDITGKAGFLRWSMAWDEDNKSILERAYCRTGYLCSAGRLIVRNRLCAE